MPSVGIDRIVTAIMVNYKPDNLDPNLFLFVESNMFFLAPIVAIIVICWRYLKRADSSAAFKLADTDLYAIDSLMTWYWELLSSYNPFSKFWCKHMPSNFGIKVILFQNYHIFIFDGSVVTGRESWSGVFYLSLPMLAHEPMLHNFYESIIASRTLGFILPGRL